MTGEPGEAGCEQEREGDEEPCERGLDGRLEVFGEVSGSVDPAECPFDNPALQQDNHGDGLQKGRLIAAIVLNGLLRCVSRRGARARRDRRDLGFDRQAQVVDGEVPLATLDFLGDIEAARPPASVVLTTGCRRQSPSRGFHPSASRAPITRTQTIRVHNPRSRQVEQVLQRGM